MNDNTQLLETLSRSEMFQNYQRSYSEMTGLPISLRPIESWQLPLHGKRKENSFCALMAEKSRTCAACLLMQEELGKAACNGPATITCSFGLCEMAVPVKLGERTIGLLQTGQVIRQTPTDALFQKAVTKARELGVDIETDAAHEAFLATPVASQKKLESATTFLGIFADHLSMVSNQIMVQQANAEPPLITKAKKFIEEHITEDLTLSQVAQVVHTSVFYFCKQFSKYTGTTFTEYVSRLRVEKAKNLLLNPNLRISEIAFEVGFQSLTHFNRVFKGVTGQSPTEYRSHFPKPAGKTPVKKERRELAMA